MRSLVSTCIVCVVVVVFVLGLQLYATKGFALVRKVNEGLGNAGLGDDGFDTTPAKVAPDYCPSTLFRRDGKYVLVVQPGLVAKGEKEGDKKEEKDKKEEGEEEKKDHEIVFATFDDYVKYRDAHLPTCPVLFVQQEYDTQGNEVERIRESPIDQDGGSVTEIADASRDQAPYNQNLYAGVDPTMQYLGVYTTLDQVHDSTRKQEISDNPMDPNWGGVLYTQAQIDQGKYDDYNITKPRYTAAMKGNIVSPYGLPPPPPES